jgi:hypothetical protein
MSNTTVNVGPLLVTMAVVFTTYLGVAFAVPAMPASIHEALVSLKGTCDETSGSRAGVDAARVGRNG